MLVGLESPTRLLGDSFQYWPYSITGYHTLSNFRKYKTVGTCLYSTTVQSVVLKMISICEVFIALYFVYCLAAIVYH